jgi:16S rRNA processing protein RimM
MVRPDHFICLAVVTAPHGVGGRVKLKSFANPRTAFADFKPLYDEAGTQISLRLDGEAGGCFIVSIDGLKTRDEAALWRGRKLGVPRSALPESDSDDRLYIADLLGMKVISKDGAAFGTVKQVYNFGAGDILEITRVDGREEMFTFTQANFPERDAARRILTIVPPDIIEGGRP